MCEPAASLGRLLAMSDRLKSAAVVVISMARLDRLSARVTDAGSVPPTQYLKVLVWVRSLLPGGGVVLCTLRIWC